MISPIVIVENKEIIPDIIKTWTKEHSVPIVHFENKSCEENKQELNNYSYVIEYSEEITIKYLEIAYFHACGIPAVIAETENLIIKEIGMEETEAYRNIIETFPEAVSDKTLLGLTSEEFAERHRAYMKYSYGLMGYGIYGVYKKNLNSGYGCDNQILEKNNRYSGYKPEGVSSVMIGIAGLDGTETPSLSYALLKKFQGRGYAFEACKTILDYSYDELGMDKVNISVAKDNISSLRLAEKLKERYNIRGSRIILMMS